MAFHSDFVRTLERLYLLARRHMTHSEPGERTSPRRGGSLEFSDYRSYVPGDEIRYIDWNVYMRHGSLFVKEFSAEESIHLSLLVDASASMGFGTPEKLEIARELAAAIGYIGLVSFDTVSLHSFNETLHEHRSHLRGKKAIFELLQGLDEIRPAGHTDLKVVLRACPEVRKERRMLVVLTDFYDAGYAEVFRALQARRIPAHWIHLVSEAESNPGLRGRLALEDLETGRRREIRLTEELVQHYRERMSRYFSEVERGSSAAEMRYVRVRCEDPIEERVMAIVRRGGILELR